MVAEGDSQVSVKMMVDPALPVVKCLDFGHLSVEPLPAFYYCVQQCWCCHRGEQIQEKEFIDIKLTKGRNSENLKPPPLFTATYSHMNTHLKVFSL